MLLIAFFALLVVAWYILCDQVASFRVVYQFPAGCCSCGAQSGLKSWALQRSWFFGDHEIFDLIFPVASREAVIPICETCLGRVEAHKRRNLKIAWMTALLAFVLLALLAYRLVIKFAFCAGSLSEPFCNIFSPAVGGFLGAVVLFAVLWELTSLLPALALPARFNLLGKLRFTNPEYQQKYQHLNPSPAIPVPQPRMPVGIHVAAMGALLFSILSDLEMILNSRRRDASLQIVPINYLLILAKAGTIAMFWRMKKAALLLWVGIMAAEFVLNPNYDLNDRADELMVAAALMLIFLYEWWQTRRSAARA